MLDVLKNLGDFFGVMLNKFLMALPHSSFTASDVTSGIDTFNESHFLNYLNWFIPINDMLNLFNLWLGGMTLGISTFLLIRFLIKKFGG